jgi:hypothetical protein
MQTKRNTVERTRVKIGTILDKKIVDRLKERSAREGKSISSLIEDAVLKYKTENASTREMRLKAMDKFFSVRFNISDEDWKTIMAEDYYEQ